jgi:predicted nucleic acid-binding protein
MDVVIDTSALIAVIVAEPERDRIIELVIERTLIGPGSIEWEVGNAFSAMLKKRQLELEDAKKGIEIFNHVKIRYIAPDLIRVMELCNEKNIYAYDAYFLDCAIRFNAPLLSLDKKLKSIAKNLQIAVLEV